MVPKARLACAAALAALLAAGCGSSSSSSSSSGTQASSTPTAGTTAAPTNTPEVNPAGDIPDNQAYVAYSPPGAGYSVKVPEGWSRTAGAGAISFTDKLNTVRLQADKAASAPTVTGVRHAVVPQLARTEPGFKAGTVESVHRTAGRAVRIVYLARSKADPVTGKTRVDAVERYVFFHNGREAVVTLSGPKGADNVDPWRIITNSLRWTG
jgi:hypothetical protein